MDAPAPGRWQTATVVAIVQETRTAKSFRLALAHPGAHLAGQHYILRLTAPDGYTASRSYSVASAPDDSASIEITVERHSITRLSRSNGTEPAQTVEPQLELPTPPDG